ncbi:hypothetical protein Mgra_00004630 [Meloidogyne graminicola]|uniref:Uncharacterized protein n=1 Tax=Meloidogyne graminicola TaxID=189291 RepID=A0A8S9ZR69_9BILA|nr:hypothetical protein Mgra_00004630 [Meloidogyne graminicola]
MSKNQKLISSTSEQIQQKFNYQINSKNNLLNILLLGDEYSDKNKLICTYMNIFFPEQHKNNCLFFEHTINTIIKEIPTTIRIWDLYGQPCYDKLRYLAYKQINFDVFIVCFSVVNPQTLENVKNIWLPEIKRKCPNTPFLLVGTQIELRTDKKTYDNLQLKGQLPITYSFGLKLAKKFKAKNYFEISTDRRQGLFELFEEIIIIAINNNF